MKIVLPISGFNTTVWMVHCWLTNYEKSKSDLEPVLFYDSASYEILSYWPYKKVESDDLVQLINYRKDDDFLFSQIRTDFLRLLSFNYFGRCLTSDVKCMINKRIESDKLPDCEWGACIKTNKFMGRDSEWSNIIYTRFDEFSFVQEILTETMILENDFSIECLELYHQYKNRFYDMEVYPFLHRAIISLVHKKNKGTFISNDWCKDYDKKNKDSIFCHYHNQKSFDLLLDRKLSQPKIAD